MEFNKNVLLFGTACFFAVLFGRFTAVISGRKNDAEGTKRNVVRFEDGPTMETVFQYHDSPPISQYPSRLVELSYKIKTYQNVDDNTFYKTPFLNIREISDEELGYRLQSKISEIKKTYASYLEAHLFFLDALQGRPIHDVFGDTLRTDYVSNVVDLVAKCRRSLVNSSVDPPEWLDRYADLLKGVQFLPNEGGSITLAVRSVSELSELRTTLEEVFSDDYEGFPRSQYSDLLAAKGYYESEFRKKKSLPYTAYVYRIREIMGPYTEYKCVQWFKYYRKILDSGMELKKCLTIIHHYQMNMNLMNLHIVLDVNNEILPYNDMQTYDINVERVAKSEV